MKILSNNSPSKRKVTIVGCVHGNEHFGRMVFEYFEKILTGLPGLTIILANTKAMEANQRYLDADLNRVFPGSKAGNHEERLAYKLTGVIDPTSFVVDIHTTYSPMTMTPIVCNLSKPTRAILNSLPSKNIVVMGTSPQSLIGQYKAGVSLEYNRKFATQPKNLTELEKLVRNLLAGKNVKPKLRQIYRCTGTIANSIRIPKTSQNFELITGTNIVPFLLLEPEYKDFQGFALSTPKLVRI